jgi:hypothetical protein
MDDHVISRLSGPDGQGLTETPRGPRDQGPASRGHDFKNLIDATELEDVQRAKNNDEDQDRGNGFHGG